MLLREGGLSVHGGHGEQFRFALAGMLSGPCLALKKESVRDWPRKHGTQFLASDSCYGGWFTLEKRGLDPHNGY
jgi:hypothetical protein